MRSKKVIIAGFVWGLLVFLNFSPAIYQGIFGNGGTFVKYYHFNVTGDSLLNIIEKNFDHMTDKGECPYITSISEDKNGSGFTHVILYSEDSDENMHFWVRTKQEANSEGTEIVFYGISKSQNFIECRQINREDFISRELKIVKFERRVIDLLERSKAGT